MLYYEIVLSGKKNIIKNNKPMLEKHLKKNINEKSEKRTAAIIEALSRFECTQPFDLDHIFLCTHTLFNAYTFKFSQISEEIFHT